MSKNVNTKYHESERIITNDNPFLIQINVSVDK